MKKPLVFLCAFLLSLARISLSQSSRPASFHPNPPPATLAAGDFVHRAMQGRPWERGLFFDGGFGTGRQTSDHFLSAGVRLGKVLTAPIGPGIARGQFEYLAELIPYWQAFTPRQTYGLIVTSPPEIRRVATGGAYTGLSLTPIILRWNLVQRPGRWRRVMPWVQAAGGLVWTNHKFPPNGSRGTSVWNFEPQFGIGLHYFVKPGRAITFAANAVHISSASLGDSNPGVNATVQFQIGYTGWK